MEFCLSSLRFWRPVIFMITLSSIVNGVNAIWKAAKPNWSYLHMFMLLFVIRSMIQNSLSHSTTTLLYSDETISSSAAMADHSHPIGCILWNSFVESHYVHVCNTPRHASQTTHHIQREKNIRSFMGQIQSVPLQMHFCQKNTCIYVNVNAQELLIYRMDTWIFS